MNIKLIGVLTAVSIIFLSITAESSAACAKDCVTIVTTDFKGRPPFKRSYETITATEILPVKVEKVGELTEVRTVDFRGRPPFKRQTERLPKVEIDEFKFSAEKESAKLKHRRVGGSSMFKKRR
jgi:hypothetical protein